jgi:ketosteroid isomerase-like protein
MRPGIAANWNKESDRQNENTALLLVLIPSAFVAPSATGDSRAADASAIQALDEQWSATAARNDLEGTVAFYADDAVLLPPNAPIATDRKSIRESWAGLLGPNTAVSWNISKVEVAKSGELAYLLWNLLALHPGSERRTAGP